jgi:hypothetical protein
MLNIRTIILSVVLVILLVFAVQLVTARTEAVSNPASDSASVIENQEGSANQNKAPIPSYRSRLDKCFDVPVSEVSACRIEGQTVVSSYRSRLDECFDVPVSELANCRSASQASTP